ncbi:ribbon-helix-helix domain-containing protein [Rhizobium sp. RU33A]|uniref:ribbon-helix-helix domain-containing protein n=1 Tax=Rhizobium sp. RU33A TaxID=1907413 RepID=UPI0009702DAF|nr:ribbon-helix-helix domain-containing protein [Rhizobium sp. RU33A]
MMRDHDQLKPHFRAIRSAGKRHGFNLERVFWTALDEVAQSEGVSVATYLENLSDRREGTSGLSSQLRASIMHGILDRYEALKQLANSHNSTRIVAACPAPAFILSLDKRILFQNSAFLMYLKTRFSNLELNGSFTSLRLTLDNSVTDIIKAMKEDDGRGRQTGFTITYNDRKARGVLSMALASDLEKSDAVIAFVTGSG